MISVTTDEVQAGDAIRFSPQGTSYTVARTQIHSFEHSLRLLAFDRSGPGDVYMPADARVYATQMWRTADVPCLAARHDELVTIRYNKANGGVPHGVLCGDVDAEIMAEFLAMKEKEGQA